MGAPVPLDDLPNFGLSGIPVPDVDLPEAGSPDEPGILSELKRGFMQGALETERQAGVAMSQVLPEWLPGGRVARETQGRVEAVAPQYERPESVSAMPWYTPTRVAGAVGQTGASMLPGLAVGGTMAASGVASVPAAVVSGAIAGYQEAEAFYRERIAEGVPEEQAYREALVAFPIIGALNVLPFERIFRRGTGRLVTGALEAGTEIAEEPVQALIAGKDPVAATIEGAKEVGPAAFILGAALGGGSGQQPSSVDRERFKARVGEPVPAEDLPIDLDAVAREYAPGTAPQLTGPLGAVRPPAPDFTVDPYGRAVRPGEALPDDRGLPAPQPSGQYDVTPEGATVPLTEAQAAERDRQRQDRAALGLGESERLAWNAEQEPWRREQRAGERGDTPAIEPPDFSAMASRPVWYSQTQRLVESGPTRAPGQAWLAYLRNKGAKADELAWTGADEWLAAQKGQVSREQLAQYLKQNEVQVEEVLKGKSQARSGLTDQQIVDRMGEITGQMEELGREAQRTGQPVDEARYQELWRQREALNNEWNDEAPGGAPKFANWQLPGGENYRELLLRLPSRSTMRDDFEVVNQGRIGNGWILGVRNKRTGEMVLKPEATPYSPDQFIDKYYSSHRADLHPVKDEFRGGHYDEPNILAHVRFNDRTDADGKRVLFVEEIQSDWHQKGRKEGYGKQKLSPAEEKRLVELRAIRPDQRTQEQFDELTDLTNRSAGMTAVPDAPFKTTWPDLALKRMIRWAAENGYDRIAWTPGEVQADRYDLSKVVNRIEWSGLPKTDATRAVIDLKDGDAQELIIDQKGTVIGGSIQEAVGKSLADVVGKDVSEKILAERYGTLSGLDLKVGGEGMRGFYDKILVDAANKLGKKFGARVGKSEISSQQEIDDIESRRRLIIDAAVEANLAGNRREVDRLTDIQQKIERHLRGMRPRTVHSLDITPQMRESVMQGQPLFRRGKPKTATERTSIRMAVESVVRKWGANAPDLKIVATAQELPVRILQSTGLEVEGAYDPKTGTIWLVEESIATPADALRVLAHEAVGHYGMMQMMGPKFPALLADLRALAARDKRIGAIAADIAERYSDKSENVQAMEVIATLAEQQPNHGLVMRALAMLRAAWKRLGFNLKLSTNDLIYMLRRAEAFNEQGGMQEEALAARRPKSDAGHKREISTGRYVGAPDWVRNDPRQLVKLRKTLRKLAREGHVGRWWYEKSARAVMRLVGGNKAEAEKFIGLLAIYSQGTSVGANTTGALKAWFQWKAGLPITAGRFPSSQGPKAEAWLNRGEDWGGIKTNNFYTDLMGEIDPSKVDLEHSTMDMWMALAFDYGSKVLDQGPKYKFAQREIAMLARELGWRPHQVQAAVWTAIKARVEASAKERNAYEDENGIRVKDENGHSVIAKGREYEHFRAAHRFGMESPITQAEIDASDYDFGTALGQREATVSWEATPGVTSGVLPGIHAAPMSQVKEYLKAIRRALTGADGRDMIDARLGLLTTTGLEGASGWQGKTTYGVQQQAGVTVDGAAVSGPSRVLVNLAADIRGLVLSQEAVAWHFPIFSGGQFGQNGVEYTIGRRLTEAETEGLYQSLQAELGHGMAPPIPTETGFRVLNFPDEKFALMGETDPATVRKLQGVLRKKNRDFHAAVERAVHAQPFHGEVTGDERFETDGELRENDWSKGDADYRSRIAEAARSLQGEGREQGRRPELADLQKWIDDDLRPRVDAVNRRFAEKYGWDQPAEEVAPLASRPRGDTRDTTGTFGANAPQQEAAPETFTFEAGGGTYTSAPFAGLDPEAQRVLMGVMRAEESNIADERGNDGEPITWEQTDREAEALLRGSFGRTHNALVNRLPRGAANAKLMAALARIVNSYAKNVQAAVERYNRTGSAQDLVRLNAAREQLGVVLAPYMGYRTEAGRALNILRKVQSDFADAQAIFEALGDGNEDAMREFARQVKTAGSVAEVLEITRASYQPTAIDQFREFWINGLLSGPWTHAVNILSNTAFQMLDAGTEVAVSLVSPNVSTRAALQRFTGMMAGISLGIQNAKRAFLTEEPQLDQRTQVENQKRQAISGRKGRIIRLPGRLLMAEDEFAKAINYTGELYRMAMEEAQRLNPRDPHAVFEQVLQSYANNRAVKAKARAHADRMTFQSQLGSLGKRAMSLREEVPFGWVLAPFIRTPTNILKRAMEYTPAALAMPSVRDAVKAGGRDAALAKGRMLIGGAAMLGVASLVAQGLLTGAGPDDPGERALWMRTGRKPYSAYNPFTKEWVRYNRFEPIGMLVGIAADMAEMTSAGLKGKWDQVPTMLLSSIMLNLADKTYLRGIVDFIQATNDPKRYLAQWAQNTATSVIPNILAQGARATDPFVREARGLVDTAKGKIPGLRSSLPMKLDIAGEPIERAIFEPAASSAARNDPLAQAMLNLGVFRREPDRKLNLGGREIELSGKDYESMKAFVQRKRWEKLSPMVSGLAFQRLVASDPLRAQKALGDAWDRVGSGAKLMWLRDNPRIRAELQGAPRKARDPSIYAVQ